MFVKKHANSSTLKTFTVALLYGRDILPNAERTYLYPFTGFKIFNYTIQGEASSGKKLDAGSVNLEIPIGIGLKHFFKSDVLYLFNNMDLNAGFSLPAISGKWKKNGAEYLTGTNTLKTTFFFTIAIGF